MEHAERLRCGANLSERGQNVRLRMSAVSLAFGLALAIVLFELDAARAWRWSTFVPFFIASCGALQGLLRTCPGHSRKGTRESGWGRAVPLPDDRSVEVSRRLARQVLTASVVLSAGASGLLFALP